ncbi:hypothetical protein IF1G_05817 [Cordyceps javanica]|uniref:Uncharacterized protein n=1 Tax=Cordyceps javanica TaxID=43265 RepID=A0A545VYM6_9HYPO|nr:hypothetical protein IF1G_05817 [Cordyceps javanica]TQW06809.1 hypothetical protein IF2G_05193 [Cordyceps javanica]
MPLQARTTLITSYIGTLRGLVKPDWEGSLSKKRLVPPQTQLYQTPETCSRRLDSETLHTQTFHALFFFFMAIRCVSARLGTAAGRHTNLPLSFRARQGAFIFLQLTYICRVMMGNSQFRTCPSGNPKHLQWQFHCQITRVSATLRRTRVSE